MPEAPKGDLKKLGIQRATRVVSLADLLVRLVILLGVVWSFLENIYKLIFWLFWGNIRFALALCFEKLFASEKEGDQKPLW